MTSENKARGSITRYAIRSIPLELHHVTIMGQDGVCVIVIGREDRYSPDNATSRWGRRSRRYAPPRWGTAPRSSAAAYGDSIFTRKAKAALPSVHWPHTSTAYSPTGSMCSGRSCRISGSAARSTRFGRFGSPKDTSILSASVVSADWKSGVQAKARRELGATDRTSSGRAPAGIVMGLADSGRVEKG